MKFFVKYQYSNERILIETNEKTRVEDVINKVKDYFSLTDIPSYADEHDKRIKVFKLKIIYMGNELKNEWLINDLGIPEGSSLKCLIIEEIVPEFYVHIKFKKKIYKIYEANYQMISYTVLKLRVKLSEELGLPLSTFRLKSNEQELSDDLRLIDYHIHRHDHVTLETWFGWDTFLKNCIKGYTKQVIKSLSHDELIRQYQAKVALYIASHYGHIDLAHRLVRMGAHPDRPVGEHPNKQWETSFKNASVKAEFLRCPIHEAVINGHMKIVTFFLSIGSWMLEVKDGFGVSTWRIALRYLKVRNDRYEARKEVTLFLLTQNNKVKLFGQLFVSNAFLYRLLQWKDRAKERVLILHGQQKSSLKKRPFHRGGLVGYQSLIYGFNNNFKETCNSYDEAKLKNQSFYPVTQEEKLRHRHIEDYFRKLNSTKSFIKPVTLMKPKKQETRAKKSWKRLVRKQIKMNILRKYAIELESLGIKIEIPQVESEYACVKVSVDTANKKLYGQRSTSENKHYTRKPIVKLNSSMGIHLPQIINDSPKQRTTPTLTTTPQKLSNDDNCTMKHYLKLCSGATPRETAQKCLSSAHSFKHISYLKQLQIGNLMVKKIVKRRIDLKETSI